MSISDMGRWLGLQGRLDESLAYHQEAVERARSTLDSDDWYVGRALYYQGQALVDAGRVEEAEQVYVEAYENLKVSRGPRHMWARRTAGRLVDLFERTGDERKRAEWQATLTEIESG